MVSATNNSALSENVVSQYDFVFCGWRTCTRKNMFVIKSARRQYLISCGNGLKIMGFDEILGVSGTQEEGVAHVY